MCSPNIAQLDFVHGNGRLPYPRSASHLDLFPASYRFQNVGQFSDLCTRAARTYLLMENLVDHFHILQILILYLPMFLGLWLTFPWVCTSFYVVSRGFHLVKANSVVLHVTPSSLEIVFILVRRGSS